MSVAKPVIVVPTVNQKCVQLLEELLEEAKTGKIQKIGVLVAEVGGTFRIVGTGGNRFEDAGQLFYLALQVLESE